MTDEQTSPQEQPPEQSPEQPPKDPPPQPPSEETALEKEILAIKAELAKVSEALAETKKSPPAAAADPDRQELMALVHNLRAELSEAKAELQALRASAGAAKPQSHHPARHRWL